MKRCIENALFLQKWLLLFLLPLPVKMEDKYCRPEDNVNMAMPFRLLHKDVCPLAKNELLERTYGDPIECAMKCTPDPFCAGYNFKEKEQKKPNCQLTHSLDHQFNSCSKDDKGWNFYHPVARRKVPCDKMKNCKNGEKTIIDLKDGPGTDPYRCECLKGYKGKLCEIGPKSMIFKKNVNDYAISKGAPVMKNITVCYWVNTYLQTGNKTGQRYSPHIISYAIADKIGTDNNHFIIFGVAELGLYITTGTISTSSKKIKVNDGRWHHICVTWQSKDGQYSFYKDGKKVGGGTFLKTVDKLLRTGGTWVLGHDQDVLGGRFQVSQAFEGEMTEVNIWNKVLTEDEIQLKLSTNCESERANGNVKSWADFVSGIRGNLGIGKPTCCCQ